MYCKAPHRPISKVRGTPDSYEVVLTAVSEDGMALQFASDALRGNVDIVTAAVTQNAMALRCASERLRGNAELVRIAAGKMGLALQFGSVAVRGDKDIVMSAVQQDGVALQWASEELRRDVEIVKCAVSQTWRALQFASQALLAIDSHLQELVPLLAELYIVRIRVLSGRQFVLATHTEPLNVEPLLGLCAKHFGLEAHQTKAARLVWVTTSVAEEAHDFNGSLPRPGEVNDLQLLVQSFP
mmetsp:Transcript_56973/g.128052  ORF Transcript_56973/g.128052 Transcript_56973/m.128052 type:complete len:241 (+) Transcript_56973:56-778(+)